MRTVLRPAALLLTAALLCADLAGLLAPADTTIWRALAAVEGTVRRADLPTVLAVDQRTVALLGPPPWDGPTWERVVDTLQAQGLDDVLLADPWALLVRPDAVVHHPTMRIRAPSGAWDGRQSPGALPAWLRADPRTLALTEPGGSLRDAAHVPAGGGSAWLACPAGAAHCLGAPELALLRPRVADIATVSLADLLEAPPGFLSAGGQGVWLGLTASPFADTVPLGPKGTPRPWVLAAAAVYGTAHATRPVAVLPAPARAAWVGALYALVALSLAGRRWRHWLWLGPITGAVFAIGASRLGGVEAPLLAGMAAALAPAIGEGIGASRNAIVAVRRLALLIIRAASRAGTLRRRLTQPAEVFEVLADLTRSHGEDAPFALLLAEPGRDALIVAGMVGLAPGDLVTDHLRASHADVQTARRATLGVRSCAMFRDGRPARLVPLAQGDVQVGFWLIGPDQHGALVDPRRIGRLARWVGERLALPGLPGTFSATASHLEEATEDLALENLFQAAEEERRRWIACVQSLGMPVFVADVAGVMDNLNGSLDDALEDAEMARPRSIRELLFQVDGDARLERLSHRLFVDNDAISVPWPDGRNLVIRPVASAGDDSALLGYLGWVTADAINPHGPQTIQVRDAEATIPDVPRVGMP